MIPSPGTRAPRDPAGRRTCAEANLLAVDRPMSSWIVFRRRAIRAAASWLLVAASVAPLEAQEPNDSLIVALAHQAIELYQAGRYAEALPVTERLVELHRAATVKDDAEYLATLELLAAIYLELDDLAGLRRTFEEQVHVARRVFGDAAPDFAVLLRDVGRFLLHTGHPRDALPLFRESYEVRKRSGLPPDEEYASILDLYARLLVETGDLAGSEPLLRELLAVQRSLHGDRSREYAVPLSHLADALRQLGNYDESVRLGHELVDIFRELVGETHPDYANALSNLSVTFKDRGDMAEAKAYAEAAIGAWRASGDTLDFAFSLALNNLGVVLAHTGDVGESRRLLNRAIEVLRHAVEPNHPEIGNSLANLAAVLRTQGYYIEADSLLREAVRIFEAALGVSHPRIAWALDNLALVRSEAGDLRSAEELYRRVVEIRRTALRTGHPEYALALGSLARTLQALGRHAEAEAMLLDAIALEATSIAPGHPHYLHLRRALAQYYLKSGDYDRAETTLRAAAAEWRERFGDEQLVFSDWLLDLAEIARVRGDHAEVEALLHEAARISQRYGGPTATRALTILTRLAADMDSWGDMAGADRLIGQLVAEIRTADPGDLAAAVAVLNLAEIQRTRGRLADAESLVREALDRYVRHLGEHHPGLAEPLNVLGIVLTERGNYAEAEQTLRRATDVLTRANATESPAYANVLNNLAALHLALGDVDETIRLRLEALEIYRKTVGETHPTYGILLQNLAVDAAARNDFDRAAGYLEQALDLIARTRGTTSPDYALVLINLGTIRSFQNDRDRAAEDLAQAAEIVRATVGEMSERYALILRQRAVFAVMEGDVDRADSLVVRSYEILTAIHGPDHPLVAQALVELGSLRILQGRRAEASTHFDRALSIQQRTLEQVFSFASERGMLAFATATNDALYWMVTLAETGEAAAESALEWVLRRKGAVLSTLATYRQAERILATDARVAGHASRLRSVREQTSRLALEPPRGIPADSLEQIRSRLRRERDQLEAELSRALSGRIPTVNSRVTADASLVAEVRAALPARTALLEMVRYQRFRGDIDDFERSWHYAAFVLRPGAPVIFVDLGDAEWIEEAIAHTRDAHADPTDEDRFREAASEVYDLVFQPLAAHLDGIDRIVVSADGELHRVPFQALVDDDGRYLIERFRIAYVSSGADLVRPRSAPGKGTVVFAGPDFDEAATGQARPIDPIPPFPDVSMTLRGLKWDALPGARAEADDVRRSLAGTAWAPVETFVGDRATEAAFKTVHSPRILHVATHGFFVPEREMTPEERARCLEGGLAPAVDVETGMGRGIERLRCADNPLHRSGIVLSGANAIGAASGSEDGWVLAEEIALLDLSGTELVVLSACETGLGDVRVGEGVYGMRRAFELAGAQRVLMSLYKVPDRETRQLLDGFYSRLAAGLAPEDALRESQLALMEGAPHPLFWASFVLVGR